MYVNFMKSKYKSNISDENWASEFRYHKYKIHKILNLIKMLKFSIFKYWLHTDNIFGTMGYIKILPVSFYILNVATRKFAVTDVACSPIGQRCSHSLWRMRGPPCVNDLETNLPGFLGRPFYTHLSLFFVRRLRSMPSIRFSKHRCIACCFSGGWLFTILFLRSEKYCGSRSGTEGGEKTGKAD